MKTKQDLVLDLITKNDLGQEQPDHIIYRISRLLGISQRQVLLYLGTPKEHVPKPRKPKPNRG